MEELDDAVRAIANTLCAGTTLNMLKKAAQICILRSASWALINPRIMARGLNMSHHATILIKNLIAPRTPESFGMRQK